VLSTLLHSLLVQSAVCFILRETTQSTATTRFFVVVVSITHVDCAVYNGIIIKCFALMQAANILVDGNDTLNDLRCAEFQQIAPVHIWR
jgi:hypothetical protein